jgi:hypothetical protein
VLDVKVIKITKENSYSEMALDEFYEKLNMLDYHYSEATCSDDTLYLPGSVTFKDNFELRCRYIFRKAQDATSSDNEAMYKLSIIELINK